MGGYQDSTPFPYRCECGSKSCSRRILLRHPDYLRRAERGPVLAVGCPTYRRQQREAA